MNRFGVLIKKPEVFKLLRAGLARVGELILMLDF
jgi:hypothetical protein